MQKKLIDEIERRFSCGNIGGLLWSSPNNPSWVCLKEKELAGVGKLLTQYDVMGIEDAAYLGMDYRQDYSVPGQRQTTRVLTQEAKPGRAV